MIINNSCMDTRDWCLDRAYSSAAGVIFKARSHRASAVCSDRLRSIGYGTQSQDGQLALTLGANCIVDNKSVLI